jgi:hypothetical protein
MALGPKEAAMRAMREAKASRVVSRRVTEIPAERYQKSGRGRPRKLDALTPAEKQRAYRARKRA